MPSRLVSPLVKLYVFAVTVLLPMDWFAPTGHVLREFGAKPATLVLTLGGIAGFAYLPSQRVRHSSTEFSALVLFAAWLALGFVAALANFMLGWSHWNALRDPGSQLIDQGMLVACCAIAVIGNSRLARAYPLAELMGRYLPAAVLLHLGIFALQAAGILSDSALPLSLFRASELEDVHRPTGLFSEPSYFGTFAGLYGSALLLLPANSLSRAWRIILVIALFVCSVLLGAKTFVVVVGAQAAFLLMRETRTLRARIASLTMLAAVALVAIFFIQRYSALDVEENLSSADRLGSGLLAVNVAAHGYALPGIGFGQFHFFYRDEFAPSFLYLSREASLQLTPEAPNRASTYNFYLRVLLETGALGLGLLLIALRRLWQVVPPRSLLYVPMLFAGSLGFLMTQDSYFYPPLVFSSALLIAIASRAPAPAPAPAPEAAPLPDPPLGSATHG